MQTGCCSACLAAGAGCATAAVSRREFIGSASAPFAAAAAGDPVRQSPVRKALRVLPVLLYTHRERKPAASWRWTAEIYDERLAGEERTRIGRELELIRKRADFPVEFLPLVSVKSKEQAASIPSGYDAMILYAAARSADIMEVMVRPGKWNLVFVRHRSGPIYYMYVGVHGHFLRKQSDRIAQPGVTPQDVVVDSQDDLLWRLRAVSGLHNTLGKRVVCIGSAGGWGVGGRRAPDRARDRWQFDLQQVSYVELGKRLESAYRNPTLLKRAKQAAGDYLARKGTKLETSREFYEKSFVLTEVYRDLMDEFKTDATTINGCMGTVMPLSGTTACMPLSILNDEGYISLCESDFVSIPAGILLHYISGKPVFMANGSFPYAGEVTVSHCTAPRRMDGANAEPVRILTHYESDFGAAPKVEMRTGQKLTVLDPDFESQRYLGFRGEIKGAPFFPMCRTQLEIGVNGDTTRLADELRGWHWMLCYGDYLKEAGYAVRKAGLEWLAL